MAEELLCLLLSDYPIKVRRIEKHPWIETAFFNPLGAKATLIPKNLGLHF